MEEKTQENQQQTQQQQKKTRKRIHVYRVILIDSGGDRKKTVETSDWKRVVEISRKWKSKNPDGIVMVLGSIYTVYEIL